MVQIRSKVLHLLTAITLVIAGLFIYQDVLAQTQFTATFNLSGGGNDITTFNYNGVEINEIDSISISKIGITSSSSSGNFRGSNWPIGATSGSEIFTGSIDLTKYIEIYIEPASGYQLSVESIAFGIGRSGTGPRQWEIRTDEDGFAIAVDNFTSLNGAISNINGVLTVPDSDDGWTGNVLNLSSVISNKTTISRIRIYGYNAEGTSGTGGIQGNLTIIGTFEALTGTPLLSVSQATLNPLNYVISEGPSYSYSYNLFASDLIGSGDIEIDAPSNFEISTDDANYFDQLLIPFNNGVIVNQPSMVYVRMKSGLALGSYAGDILHSGGGSVVKKVAVSGSVFSQEGLQIINSNSIYLIDFDNTVVEVNNAQFNGSGFTPSPTAGQLNSNAWAMTGWSDGALSFGGSQTTGDFARGVSVGGVNTGGVYAFTVSTGNQALGFQPGSSDWAPGSLTLKVQNRHPNTIIDSISIAYTIYVRNDQGRSNSFNFSYSTDNVIYNNLSELDFNSVQAIGASTWIKHVFTVDINSLSIPPSDFIYLRWNGADVSGSGSRDEFALDDIQIVANPVTNYPQFDGNVRIARLHGNASLADNLTVDSLMVLSKGTLTTNANKVILSPTASFSESSTGYLQGTIETTRDVTTVSNTFGGIGMTITPAIAMGSTTVLRITGSRLSGPENESLARYFQVIPTINADLDADIVFSYNDRELFYLDESDQIVAVENPSTDIALYKRPIGGENDDWVELTDASINTVSRTITVDGIMAFSEIVLADAKNAPLPVVLTEFSARLEAGKAIITWQTSSELNNKGFELQRSDDGASFRTLAWVAGHGTTNIPKAYSYNDASMHNDFGHYYRLKQIDFDGKYAYSPLIFLSTEGYFAEVLTYPVPTQSELRIVSSSPILSIVLTDIHGKQLHAEVLEQTISSVDLQLGNLPRGIYLVQISTQAGIYTKRVIKE